MPPVSKTIVITGASDGVGAAAARQLHSAGHRVIIVGRSPSKTKAVSEACGGAPYFLADFQSLKEVRKLAADLDKACDRIDVLANNAGGVFGKTKLTEDGLEPTMQINHYAGFLLTHLLMPKLIASKATIIQTSSIAARIRGKVTLDELETPPESLGAINLYGQAKLANILYTVELDRRYRSKGINTVCFHPGNVATSFGSDTSSWVMTFFARNPLFRWLVYITPEEAGKRLAFFCEKDPDKGEWERGKYYEDYKIAKKINPQSYDAKLAKDFWEVSERKLGVTTE